MPPHMSLSHIGIGIDSPTQTKFVGNLYNFASTMIICYHTNNAMSYKEKSLDGNWWFFLDKVTHPNDWWELPQFS